MFNGSALLDSCVSKCLSAQSDDVELSDSNSKRGKGSRAVHHNQHYRGVQRPAQWKAEKESRSQMHRFFDFRKLIIVLSLKNMNMRNEF